MDDSLLPAIRRVVHQFEALGITYALGGSALLHSLHLIDYVRDWDLTTDTPCEIVGEALVQSGIRYQVALVGDQPFASKYRLSVAASSEEPSLPIDVIGYFAIRTEYGLCRLPCRAAFEWEGLHMASPEIWAVAYELMGRQAKAELLYGYLRQYGAQHDSIQLLLEEPLPPNIRAKLEQMATVLRPEYRI